MLNKKVFSLVILLGLGILVEGRAYAYLDPGTGSAAVQAVIAGALGGILFLRAYYGRIKSLISRLFKANRDGNKTD